jgi:hypothetical protein
VGSPPGNGDPPQPVKNATTNGTKNRALEVEAGIAVALSSRRKR